ncbi:Gfo/Idh/MocA family protein [Paenibacillus nasutitermitis]|uniref:Inositol 2-dehydrogenase n=1 Tax=Paenibacillus nasutitermitis TaxID=1652958 RepID=A0A916YT90_9BACL|nr:Gfo/Idh/MocA family oxidoreductase [Paenibacillus nasutitermitis]GGD59039.1 inositol 2-dehydrogenase [Paenibacillus nasutitermitis]
MSLRIGFIGAGDMARHHMKTLLEMKEVEIASVFDINKEQCHKAAEETGAAVYDSADAVLDPARIDAVFICTPQFARGELEETAARKGIHIFVEKPLGLDLDVVRKKEQIVREAGIINSTGYCLRYLDTVRKAKDYLKGREVHLIQANRYNGSHPAKWWRTLALSGGHFVDAVTHQVDMIRFVSGEFHDVNARFSQSAIKRLDPEATIYDAGAITFSMKSGLIGSITETCMSNYHAGHDIKLFGHDFFVHISQNGITVEIVDNEQNITQTSKLDCYREQNKAFVQAVLSGRQDIILSSYADGMKTLAFSLAANQSALENRTIEL